AMNGISDVRGEEGDVVQGMLSDGLPARLRCVEPHAFAAALLWETGSDAHLDSLAAHALARGMTLDRDGVSQGEMRTPGTEEAALYSALGLQYLPPELREGWGEIAVAAAGTVPRLVELADLRGTFHCHTTASDGKSSLREMADGARALGWEYLGIADHSRTAAYAGGLSPEALLAQCTEIDRLNQAEKPGG